MKVKQRQVGSSLPKTLLVLGILTLITVLAVLNRQTIIDYIRASRFSPSPEITQLETDIALTDTAKHIFLASQPILQSASNFNDSCNQNSETNNPILGCYVRQSIFIFDVTNQKLAGIEQTTAAHELLHAVYERLSDAERKQVDAELHAAYERLKTDELEKRMEHYRKTEPGEETNELHSILGTEFDNVGPALDAHYQKYFTDRAKVLAYNRQYNGVFSAISCELKQLADQINTSVERINQQIRLHNQAVKQLEVDQQAFVSKNRSGGFTSASEFNREQQSLNSRASALNAERDSIAVAIEESNALRDRYNGLAKEYNDLNQSMNSSIAPKPSL